MQTVERSPVWPCACNIAIAVSNMYLWPKLPPLPTQKKLCLRCEGEGDSKCDGDGEASNGEGKEERANEGEVRAMTRVAHEDGKAWARRTRVWESVSPSGAIQAWGGQCEACVLCAWTDACGSMIFCISAANIPGPGRGRVDPGIVLSVLGLYASSAV